MHTFADSFIEGFGFTLGGFSIIVIFIVIAYLYFLLKKED